jgi:hypothetical protein
MPKTKLRKPCRFNVGDCVTVLSTICTRFVGNHGVVSKVHVSPTAHTHTLDKYDVLLDGHTEDVTFWDIQLKADREQSILQPTVQRAVAAVE